jgi:hypothetical protein
VVSSFKRNPASKRRSFTDSAGETWTVEERERASGGVSPIRSLLFSSTGSFRRVSGYPANWFELDEDALEKLSWSI